MELIGVSLEELPRASTPRECTSALCKLGRRKRWREAFAVLTVARRGGVQLHVVNYNAAVNVCERSGVPEHADGLLEALSQAALEADEVTHRSLASACAQGARWAEVLELLRKLPCRRSSQDPVVYNSAITALGAAGRWAGALVLLYGMRQAVARPDIVSSNAATTACGDGRRWEYVFELFEAASGRSIEVSSITYGATVGGSGSFLWACTLKMLQDMHATSVRSNPIVYSSVIGASAKRFQWMQTVGLLQDMEARGKPPKVIAWSMLLRACEQEWEWAVHALRKMRRVDLIAYSAAISASGAGRQWLRSVGLLQEMQAQRTEPDLISLTSVLSALEQDGRAEQALKAFAAMRRGDVEPGLVTHNVAISAAGKGSLWGAALFLLGALADGGVKPDAVSFTPLLSLQPAPDGAGRWPLVLDVMRRMCAAETGHDTSSYHAAVCACRGSSAWAAALRLLVEGEEQELRVDTTCFAEVLAECEQRGLKGSQSTLLERLFSTTASLARGSQ